jgi:hypothetical protein
VLIIFIKMQLPSIGKPDLQRNAQIAMPVRQLGKADSPGVNPLILQGKLQSTLDRSKYFSVDQYKQQVKLKIQSSKAFEDNEHEELRDILKKVMQGKTQLEA